MKKTFLLLMLVYIILTACDMQKNIPTVIPSVTPKQSFTATVTPVPSLTATLTPTPTSKIILPTQPSAPPTFTPFPPYQNKNVIINYSVIGNHSDYDMFFDPPSGNIITKLVLYEDGQLLIAGAGETYQSKKLSSAEISSFLLELETLGFYALESNQQSDQTDELYDFGNNYQEIHDGLWYCVSVNTDKSRNLCVREFYIQFLIPKMKNILHFLDEYKPAGMTAYYPDRIFLTRTDIDSSIDNPPAIPWDEHFPSWENDPGKITSDTCNPVIYIYGDMAKEIYMFFERSDGWMVVSLNDKEFIVYIRVLLPHEKVINLCQ
jgi:hypothetical protein